MFRIKVRGVQLGMSFGFPAVTALMLLTGGSDTARLLMVLLCSALHECGHLACMLIFDRKPEAVTLYCGGVRITPQKGRMDSMGSDAAVLLAGCAVNLMLGLASSALGGDGLFAQTNFMLCAFNLLPFRYFDGGRALELLAEGGAARTVRCIFLALVGAVIVLMSRSGAVSISLVVTYLMITLDEIAGGKDTE